MTTPSFGYGLFEGWTSGGVTCSSWVSETSNGGATFGTPHELFAAPCRFWYTWIATDALGDGYVYGDHGLYVTNNRGRTWSRSRGVGSVIDVRAVGRSVWLSVAGCAWNAPHPCTVRLLASANRGATWQPLRAQPVGAVARPAGGYEDVAGSHPGDLTRLNAKVAYLISKPEIYGPRQVFPIFVTANGGATWRHKSLACQPNNGYAYGSVRLQVAPDGALWAACAGQPAEQMQGKAIYVSTDSGRHWSERIKMALPDYARPLGLGLLYGLVPLSARTAYVVILGNFAFVTRDGGSHWRALGHAGNVTSSYGMSEVITFGAKRVWIFGATDASPAIVTLWKSSTAGVSWVPLTPEVL